MIVSRSFLDITHIGKVGFTDIEGEKEKLKG